MLLTIYLASPLGFSPEFIDYRERIKQRLALAGLIVYDPWDDERTEEFEQKIRQATAIGDSIGRRGFFLRVAREIGEHNEQLIASADMLLAVLDGMEPDSGTVAELGFASALGKRCFGLRTDTRTCGDFEGIPINLQLLRFIERSGGRLFGSVDELGRIGEKGFTENRRSA